jgi:cystathionine beta-lyase
MMDVTHNFDKQINRRNTFSYKWDQGEVLFGEKDILPLWVADMDFLSPPSAVEAILKRGAHGIYGYSYRSEEYMKSITDWFHRRHQWKFEESLLTDLPGIVTALSIAVQCFSNPGDKVIIQTPVYYPFYDVIQMNEREVVKNSLILENDYYTMNYDLLEQQLKEGAKILFLCNPHNPGGRVWKKEELIRLGELCLKYNTLVVSDDIHCDLVFEGHKYIPFASISEEFAQNSITCLAPTKTFNMPGLQTSYTVIPNPELKKKFDHKVKALSLHMVNYFGPVATMACYNEGEEWLNDLIRYIDENLQYAITYLKEHLPMLQVMEPEGTYLLWVNCRKLGLTIPELKELMFQKSKVAFSEGSVFGSEGEGYIRINLACPRETLEKALIRFSETIEKL